MNEAPPAAPETRLRDALDTLAASDLPSLPIVDPATGRVLAVLARPDALSLPPAPRLGGMATPLGVYLHDGVSSGGAGFWGLFLTGVTMSLLALTAQAAAHGAEQALAASPHLLIAWRQAAPPGLRLLLSAVSPWLPLPFVFGLLRLVPMSGTHAAEHQVVHCIERRAPLILACVRAMPRVHPRCGTNLFAGWTLFLLSFLSVFSVTQAWAWPVLDGATLAALLAAPLALTFWRRLGGWIQYWFATRPATDKQIAGAIFAAEQVLARRQQRMAPGVRVRFIPLRRVWTLGIAQILLGYASVLSVITAVTALWPGSGRWLGT